MPSLFSMPPCKHVTLYFLLIPGVLKVHSNVPWFSSFSYHTGFLYLFSHRFLSSLLLVLWFFLGIESNLLSLLSIFVFAIFLEIALIFLLALLFQLFFISVSFILFLFHGYNILFQSSIKMPLMFSYLACISCIASFFLFFFFSVLSLVWFCFFLFLLLKTNISYHLWTIRVCYYKIDNTIYMSGLLIYPAKL